MTARGDLAVDRAKEQPHARKKRNEDQRAAPGRPPCHEQDCIRSAGSLAVWEQDAHFRECTFVREAEALAAPWTLQRRCGNVQTREQAFEATRHRHTE